MTLPSYSIVVTDLDSTPHTITENVSKIETATAMSDSTDSFTFELLNENDAFSYIEKGCAIEIKTGIGTITTKIVGYVTEVVKTLDSSGIKPIMSVSGEDGSIRLNNIFFSGRFYDYEISALFKAILDASDFTTGEIYRTLADCSTNNTYIESTAFSMDEATYNWQSLGSALKDLADLVGYGWYRDTDKALHFFDPVASAVAATIVDADIEGVPTISTIGEIVNRAIVIGGYEQVTDKTGSTQTGTTTIKDDTPKNQSFVPTEDYLSSVLVYTELVTDSISDITLSIQGDSGAAPDGVTVSNGQHWTGRGWQRSMLNLFGKITPGGAPDDDNI
jgi:hypothetical protein